MKHVKIYEEKEYNIHFLSKVVANKLTKKFFAELDEFDRIVIQEDVNVKNVFVFSICFSQIHKETIKALEKFWEFTGNNKNVWSLQADNFTYDDVPKMYDIIHLNEKLIIELLEKLKLDENREKYNM